MYHRGVPLLVGFKRPGYKNRPQLFFYRKNILTLAKQLKKKKQKSITHLNGKKVINAKDAIALLEWSARRFRKTVEIGEEPLLTPIKYTTYTNKVQIFYDYNDILKLKVIKPKRKYTHYEEKERHVRKFYAFKDLEERWGISEASMDLWRELKYFHLYKFRSKQGEKQNKYLQYAIHTIERERTLLYKSYRSRGS